MEAFVLEGPYPREVFEQRSFHGFVVADHEGKIGYVIEPVTEMKVSERGIEGCRSFRAIGLQRFQKEKERFLRFTRSR